MFIDLEFLLQICIRNQSNEKIRTQKKKRRKTNLDVNQCGDAQRVLSRHVNEIKSLSLQKLEILTTVDFSGVPCPSFTLVHSMVVVLIVTTLQEQKKKKKKSSNNSRTQKPASKRNSINSKPGRRETRKNLSLSTLSDREEFF